MYQEFVIARRKDNKSNLQIMQEIDEINWAVRQGYRKPLEGWNLEMEKLFLQLVPQNEEENG